MSEESPLPPQDPAHPPRSQSDAQQPVDPEAGLTSGLEAAFARQHRGTSGIPETLGPYKIHGILGEGGMGRVYEASEEFPERRVALKVLRQGMESEVLLLRLRMICAGRLVSNSA